MNKRFVVMICSLVFTAVFLWGFSYLDWSSVSLYPIFALLAVIFLSILISNQQYEEDIFSQIERTTAALLLSYIGVFQFFYMPLGQIFFERLASGNFFLLDLLKLLFFILFLFLFGTAFFVINRFSKSGWLPSLRIFNNEPIFFISRIFFLPAVVFFGLMIFGVYI